jgi:hypothetical protein
MKTEVYSWRVSAELKTELEREARRRKVSLSALLDLAAKEWLSRSSSAVDDDEHQRRLHKAVAECCGVIAGGDPRRSENARQAVRERLRRKYGR